MPPSHRKWAEWSPERFVRWAEKIGHHTRALIDKVLRSRPHPQQGFRTALGILRLGKSYGEARLESACQRAMLIGAASYRSVASILKHSLDQTPPLQRSDESSAIVHANIRGRRYYH
jgi:transposase